MGHSDDFFLVDPYGSFWPDGSSRAGAVSATAVLEVLSYTPTVLDLVPAASSFIPESHPANSASPFIVSVGADYTSEIHNYAPSALVPRNVNMLTGGTNILRGLIARINPGSSESLDRFASSADQTLKLLARFGMENSKLLCWETLCREAEFHIRRLRSLSILRTRATL